jgi:PleD family two-component response regulator
MSTASRVDSLIHDDPPHRLSQKLAHFSTRHQAPLVITDWMMPDITGIELCGRIRCEFPTSYTYIIILNGMTDTDIVVRGF